MMNIFNSITELIGKTPLLKLSPKINKTNAEILVKLETSNPSASLKDRLAIALIDDGIKRGLINKDTVIIEPTSGNTGIGLAMVCAAKNYKCVITMPENMSEERKKILRGFGAELVLTHAADGIPGAIEKAKELNKQIKNSYIPFQFSNPANVEIHKLTTGPEIWADTDGQIDVFVAGIGSGGTFTGVSAMLKEKNKNIKCIAVEPFTSAVLSGEARGVHEIQGIGAGFIPEIVDLELIDEIIKVKNEEAIQTAKELIRQEGILCGISAGANVFAALKIAKIPENQNKKIVTIICDTGERYVTTKLFENNE